MNQQPLHANNQEKGQSIVIVAMVMIGLLAMVGLAVDVGLVYARGAALSKAVDSAVLAAVTEVIDTEDLGPADLKAGQFLNANNMPISVTQSLNTSADLNPLGAIEYAITATWPVDLYFLRLVGWEQIDVTRSAAAAYFPITDLYASRRVEDGALSTSNQAVFGPFACSSQGDPFSPLVPTWTDAYRKNGGTYQYRILVPGDYPYDIVRVELFDPDSYNSANNEGTVAHTLPWIEDGRPAVETLSCTGTRLNPCLLDTQEDELLGLPLDQVNPWWFMRIDENRYGNGSGSACNLPGSYTATYNTQTFFELYYYQRTPSGTPVRIELARYTGQVEDGVRDSGDHDTDLRWVSPGGATSYDQEVFVPIDPGGPVGNGGIPRTFEVSISQDLLNVMTDPESGDRYIYLDVTANSGSSENGFEIWAGPNNYVDTVPSDVNARNVQIVNNPGSHSSYGVTVFAMGNLPLNSNYGSTVEIPLLYIPPEYAGKTVYVSLFDPDSQAQPPVVFYFDSLAFTADGSDNHYDETRTDWAKAFAVSGVTDPDGYIGRCVPGSCDNQWVDPPYEITIPTLDPDADCSGANPNIDECTPFFGGRLIAHYRGGPNDSYGWQISLPGLPYLVK